MQNKSFLKLEEMGDVETLLSILSAIHEGIVVMARDSTIVYANAAYTRILGVPVNRVLGRKCSEIEPGVKCLETLKTQEPIRNHYEIVKSVGKHLLTNTTCIYSGGEFVGVANLFRDITEIVQLKNEHHKLQKYANNLEEQLCYYGRESLPEAFGEMIGKHPVFIQTLKFAAQVAPTEATVLIEGESGVGKELLAKAIHMSSPRKDKPFVAINCAAIPETLFESEFFGYAGGAFTGAKSGGKKGKFLLAHEGTIFLDEVGELPLSTQAKLLRVLQNYEVDPIGSDKPFPVNVRIIAATNRDLQKMVVEGNFRQDFYYRLNMFPIRIPSLREHPEDITLLVDHLLSQFNKKYAKELVFSNEVIQAFLSDAWPGNIRELENIVRHAVIIAKGPGINLEELPLYFTKRIDGEKRDMINPEALSPLKSYLNEAEKDALMDVLRQSNNNRSKAMKMLGISRGTFYKKLRKYDLL